MTNDVQQMTNDQMVEKEWYIIDDVEKLDTPALVTYPARIKQNIGLLKGMIDSTPRLRPHVKTYKNAAVTRLMLDAGIAKFKCATIAEAEMLAMCQAPDVLLAYQPVGPKLDRFIQLIFLYPETKFSCLVDNNDVAIEISAAAIQNKIDIAVYVDLNIGQNRTGIAPGDEALQLYVTCEQLPGIKPIGLHAYDGHIHDADLGIRTQKCNESFHPVNQLKAELLGLGYAEPIIIAGGSPTFPLHAQRESIECSPGTFVYWDRGYQLTLQEQPFLTAALVVTRVMSLPDKKKVCLDLGHKSVAAENILNKRVYFLNAPELEMVGQSEEHLVVESVQGHNYKIGDVLYGVPYHICPTVALYERAITIEENKITGEWATIARDRKITV
jgi:D-serine deaminase-like pyridoxal phosphate-dependent protein